MDINNKGIKMKMKIKIIVSAACLVVSSHAFSAGGSIAEKAIETAGKVAVAAINKNKSEVKVKNSTLANSVEMTEAISVGNTGISLAADKVEVSNSKIINKVKLKRAINVGNAGIKLGK